ncbi:MAG: deoxynucleoside kinase [Gammaproteobacteria bacterium]
MPEALHRHRVVEDEAALPRFIAVEGPIGVGKTTLAKRLAESFNYETLLEPAYTNPFLEKFYREGENFALSTQLYFLLHRAQQITELRQDDLFQPVRVADFLMEKDRLFAELTLNVEELALYNQVYAHLTISQPVPNHVIYLQAPKEVLLTRIKRRGITAEQYIRGDYLEALNEAYARFFHFYDAAPLLIVNASETDFVNDDAQYERLLQEILEFQGPRHYYNPHPSLL